jgi:hypothetical protein
LPEPAPEPVGEDDDEEEEDDTVLDESDDEEELLDDESEDEDVGADAETLSDFPLSERLSVR